MANEFGNFKLKNEEEIKEIKAVLREFEHTSGAEVIQIETDDDDNLFNISFRTYPNSSNGVAHVLEHIVLCGSEKYPIKDPFFSMSRRSMNTFMNALTGTDFTCYPAASQIEQDFYNLFEIYLDAVFHPRLLEESFWQEGIHLQFGEEGNLLSPLVLKGIVYNEMKGAYSSPDTRLHESIYESLFPNLPYHYSSGGNPKDIRHLTHEDLKKFHQQYYHPSRALFYFYGNLPLKKHLQFLEENALKGVKKLPPLPYLHKQKRFKERVTKKIPYPVTKDEEKKDKAIISISYLTISILEQEELLALHVIDLALMGTDAAPLKRVILESNLCKQVDSGLDDEISEIPYTIECKGCNENQAKPLFDLIQQTFKRIAKKGISEHLVEGALHQLEFSRTEIGGHSFPYGLSLFFRSGLLKQHGGTPSDGLKIHTLFKKLRENFKDKTYLPSLIKKYFLDNPHAVQIVMTPDPTLAMKELEDEIFFVKKIDESLTPEIRKKIGQNEQKLLKYQDEQGDLELLPRLHLKDIPKVAKDFPLFKEQKDEVTFYLHDCFTNDILYGALFFDLLDMSEEDLIFLKILTVLLPELGAGKRNYKEHLDFVFEHTGGIYCDLDLFISSKDPQKLKIAISLKGKALQRNVKALFSVFNDMLNKIDFSDKERIEELLKQHLEGIENSIQKNPLSYALSLAISGFSPACHLNYIWGGLHYLQSMKKVVKDYEADPKPFIKKMKELKELVLTLKPYDLVLSAETEMYSQLKEKTLYPAPKKQTPSSFFSTKHLEFKMASSQGRKIAAAVAFNVVAFPTFAYTHPDTPLLNLAGELMENQTLHKRIREQGGAYGGGSSNAASWGYFYFYSYRDPHIKTTLDAFQEAVSSLIAGNFSDSELEEAKLGILQNLDSPTPPESRSLVGYTWLQSDRSKEVRQQFRDRLMSATKEEIQRVAKTTLKPGLETAVHVTFAGQNLFDKENPLLPNPLFIYPSH